MGDSLTLIVEFRNKTSDSIDFYLGNIQFLINHFGSFEGFGNDRTLFLGDVSNRMKWYLEFELELVNLASDSTYIRKIIIRTDAVAMVQFGEGPFLLKKLFKNI